MSDERHLQLFRADSARPAFFGEVEARFLVDAESAGATAICFGSATYPPGAAIEPHLHPNAEEVVLVVDGRARHVVDATAFEMGPGDTCFIPRGRPHSLEALPPGELSILWAYGGAASVEAAGFVLVDHA